MASSKQTPKEPEENQIDLKNYNKYKTNPSSSVKGIEMDLNDLDRLLENEQQNKSENWNKLDKTQKLQKLNKSFAPKFAKLSFRKSGNCCYMSIF